MVLILQGHNFSFELENLCRLFFFRQGVHIANVPELGEDFLVTEMHPKKDGVHFNALLCLEGETWEQSASLFKPDADHPEALEHTLCRLVYELCIKATPVRPSWGLLTGIRPVKLVTQCREKGMEENEIFRYFTQDYLVSPRKAFLALETERNEREILARSFPQSFSLYISIPFCPTRCSYCSFVSQDMRGAAKLVPDYLNKLCRELDVIGEKVRSWGLHLQTVYFGGGTPTTLSAEQLELLLGHVAQQFDLSGCQEYTVEAGRPDTITREKLRVMKQAGVDRISINPQTFQDSVLEAIGRCHTAAEVLEKYGLAREEGFDFINMDLIAGLPSDTVKGFQKTLDTALSLEPENLTVHTLSLKRSSTLAMQGEGLSVYDNPAEEMMEYALSRTRQAGYAPYYLYRQKNTLGNLENIGFAKDRRFGLYNVYIMEETHTILAAGAGSSTKLVHPFQNQIRRVFDYKYPVEYIRGFEEMLRRKDEIDQFYQQVFSCDRNRQGFYEK